MASLRRIAHLEHSDAIGTQQAWCARWNRNGTLLASCGQNKSIRIWRRNAETDEFELLTTLKGDHERAVRYLDFSPCGKYLTSVGFDAIIIVYQFENGDFEEVTRMEGHENEVKCCAFSPSGRYLASCSRDKSVWFWQMDEDDDFQVSAILQPHTGDVKFVAWHPSEEVLVSCSYDCSIKFFRFDGEDWVTQQRIEEAHEGTVWSASFDSEGNYLATAGADHHIKVWKRITDDSTTSVGGSSWQQVIDYDVAGCKWPLYSISWNQLNDLIAVGGGDGRVRLLQFDPESETVAEVFSLKVDDEINSVSWNPENADLLAAASDDGFVSVYKLC